MRNDNLFSELFFNNQGPLMHKWHHYFEVYERHFNKYKGKDITFLEIGIYHGGSLTFWKNYFGPNSKIYAIDINPECKKLEEGNIRVFIGSQEDRSFWDTLKKEIPHLDILLDDGGHTMKQQIVTFEEMYDHVKEDGLFVCEDLHTSYWRKYGGGYKRKSSFIEYSKNFIDQLHALYPVKGRLQASKLATTTHSLHYYSGMLVMEKRKMDPPVDSTTGNPFVKQQPEQKRSLYKRLLGKP